MKPVNFGILGNAAIARNQMIPAMGRCQDVNLYAIASRREIPADVAPGAKRYESYDALLDDPEVEAVYIPMPNALHAPWAIKAMKKGKHVLSEKPIAMNAKEAEEMFRVAKEQGVLLMEAFMYRFSDKTKKAAELVRDGKIGKLRGIHVHHGYTLNWDSPARQDPALGGGSLYDVGCYCVSAIAHMMRQQGLKLEDCHAMFNMKDGYDERMAATLKYSNGAICTMESWFDAPGDQRMMIVGEEGIIEVLRFPGGAADEIILTNKDGRQAVACENSDLFALEAGNFARAIRGEQAELIPAEETIENMRTMDALHAFRK